MRCRFRETLVAGDAVFLRADRAGFAYKEILEVRPSSLRLLIPDVEMKRRRWYLTGAIAFAWLLGYGILFGLTWPGSRDALASWVGEAGADVLLTVVPWLEFFVGIAVVDQRMIGYLARRPRQILEMRALRMRSFWTFQELEVTTGGAPFRITIQGSRKRVARILGEAGISVPSAEPNT